MVGFEMPFWVKVQSAGSVYPRHHLSDLSCRSYRQFRELRSSLEGACEPVELCVPGSLRLCSASCT
jgi:hypothetical protein